MPCFAPSGLKTPSQNGQNYFIDTQWRGSEFGPAPAIPSNCTSRVCTRKIREKAWWYPRVSNRHDPEWLVNVAIIEPRKKQYFWIRIAIRWRVRDGRNTFNFCHLPKVSIVKHLFAVWIECPIISLSWVIFITRNLNRKSVNFVVVLRQREAQT